MAKQVKRWDTWWVQIRRNGNGRKRYRATNGYTYSEYRTLRAAQRAVRRRTWTDEEAAEHYADPANRSIAGKKPYPLQ